MNRKPDHRISNRVKGVTLLLLAFLEGWLLSYATTHTRLPIGAPQWLITGSLIMALIVPFAFVITAMKDTDDDQ